MSFDLKITNNDLTINPDGTVGTVRDNEKLGQDVLKAILTARGDNQFHRWYGSTIGVRVIGQVMDVIQTETEVERSIHDVLSFISALQKAQSKIQYVSPGETLVAIKSVDVIRDPSDPRQWQVKVLVLTRELTTVETTFSLQV
jgi:hypothetical protein